MYVVGREGVSGKVDDPVTYIIVTCNDETYIAASEGAMNQKGLQTTVTFILEVRGINIITST